MTNDRLRKTREGAGRAAVGGMAAGVNGEGGGTQDRPKHAIAVVPLWDRTRTAVRR